MEIRLKSAYDQKATVVLSNGIEPTYIALPILLQKDVEIKFGGLLVDFSNTYAVAILVDETAALGEILPTVFLNVDQCDHILF